MKRLYLSGETIEYLLGACEALGEPDPVQVLKEALEYYLDNVNWRRIRCD